MPFQWPFLIEDEKVEWRKLKNVKYPLGEGEVEWETQLAKRNLTFDVSPRSESCDNRYGGLKLIRAIEVFVSAGNAQVV
jgi:hypothetical protein